MKNEKIKWIVAIGISLFMAVVMTIDALTSDFTNVNVNVFHFKYVNKHTGGRGSLNYNLYVQENDNSYVIGANWADCFYYDDFINNVKPGAAIKVSVLKHNGLIADDDLLQAVDIESNGFSYLSLDCTNDSVKNQRNVIPVAWLAVFGLSGFYYFRTIRKKAKKTDMH